jgi:hypothetical protein
MTKRLLLLGLLLVGCGGEELFPIESDPALCSDGLDNDRDGYIDCEDANCARVCGWPELDGGP